MQSASIKPVVLCGGSGTRLWPLSRKTLPKQFVPLIGERSLLHLTLERLLGLDTEPLIVASEEHRFMVTETLQGVNSPGQVILEPVPRNTAAAMALAAVHVGEASEQLLLFSPADHHIPDNAAFIRTVRSGVRAALNGAIVTFGVLPTHPSTAYGYIREGDVRGDGSRSSKGFIEKPGVETASRLLLEGDAVWNSGIFLCTSAALSRALALHAPDILDACRKAMECASRDEALSGFGFIRPERDTFAACRAQSIDYAVMESHHDVALVRFDAQWSDVGSWNAVAALEEPDAGGNRVRGSGKLLRAKNTFIHAQDRPVVALGTQDLLIVDTPDALLVAHRANAEEVKDVVAWLESTGCTQAVSHRKVARPWGSYDSIDAGDRFQVKRLKIRPKAALSLQKHLHRAEHWVVVKGTAEVTRGDETFLLGENQSTYIPAGQLHRLRNPGLIELEIVEIQSGSYLGEDDIVRVEDAYGRK